MSANQLQSGKVETARSVGNWLGDWLDRLSRLSSLHSDQSDHDDNCSDWRQLVLISGNKLDIATF